MSKPIIIRYDRIPPAVFWRAARVKAKPKSWGKTHWLLPVGLWFVLFLIVTVLLENVAIVAQGGPAFLVGIGFMWVGIIVIGQLQQRRLNALLAEEQDRRGPTEVRMTPQEYVVTSSFGEARIPWRAFDEVILLPGGIGLRSGLMTYPIPDEALPEGMKPKDLQDILHRWISDAASPHTNKRA